MAASLHVVFFPFMAYGHMLPVADMAVLFASHNIKTTIITTPSNAHIFTNSIQKTTKNQHQISLHIIKLKPVESGLPEGCENSEHVPSNEFIPNFFEAISKLQEPVQQFLQETRPNCIIADMLFPWTTKLAAKFGIPRVVFHGTGFFALCASEMMKLYNSTDSESFIVPNLPDKIRLSRKQVPQFKVETLKEFGNVLVEAMEADMTSHGVIVNSFYELEPEYVRHYREVFKRKAWHIGPVSLCNKKIEDKFERGKKAAIDEHECLKWLNSKKPNSVVYVSFGTMATVTPSQLHEIAVALEACDEYFIWVIKNGDQEDEWMPEGFPARMKATGKGLIIKGWAPQVMILDHESVGAFVTHCGWNSVLEGVSGGVGMVTWPVMAEQFYNEKLVTEVLRIGVSIGDVEWSAASRCEGVKRVEIEKAVKRVMSGEEGEELRRRALEVKAMAKMAVEEGGSSYLDLNAFIEDIS